MLGKAIEFYTVAQPHRLQVIQLSAKLSGVRDSGSKLFFLMFPIYVKQKVMPK
jgi:hypothetical protein